MHQHTLRKRLHICRQPRRKARHRHRCGRRRGGLQNRDLAEVGVGVGIGGDDRGSSAEGGEGGDVGGVGLIFSFLVWGVREVMRRKLDRAYLFVVLVDPVVGRGICSHGERANQADCGREGACEVHDRDGLGNC